jgi:hypothetical protein
MALYPGYGVRNPDYEFGTVIQVSKPKRPGSDQGVQFLGELPYPFAPPLVPTNPPPGVLINPITGEPQ